MIDISKLTKEDIGREVILTYLNGDTFNGKIVSWDIRKDDTIYVRYDKPENKWDNNEEDETNDTTGIRTGINILNFNGPPKPKEIITRADLMILEDD